MVPLEADDAARYEPIFLAGKNMASIEKLCPNAYLANTAILRKSLPGGQQLIKTNILSEFVNDWGNTSPRSKNNCPAT